MSAQSEFLKETMGRLPAGVVAQLYSYIPVGAASPVTVLVLTTDSNDLARAGESIQRAAEADRKVMLEAMARDLHHHLDQKRA